ncbi:MAG: gamma-glutamyltransferase [Alphaproteobacteria bacterium]
MLSRLALIIRRAMPLLAVLVVFAAFSGRGADAAGPVTARQHMVVTANPHATAAGLAMLQQGGSAIDAAIAAMMVLNLVEPQSAGIGGGAFMLHYDSASRAVTSYDGRETAPLSATESLFLGADGEPLGFFDAVVGGRSVGVPGLVAMLALAHEDHGRLPWADLFQPAIRLARDGFAVSPRLHGLIAGDSHLHRDPAARAYFYDSAGQPLAVGSTLRNLPFADTLAAIASDGPAAFYGGAIAGDIVARVQAPPTGLAGDLTMADFTAYEAKERAAVCGPYRQWRVCGMGPPSSGGLTSLMILGQLAAFDLAALGPDSADAMHLLIEAERRAYADRGLYMADADFVPVPVAGLLDPGYLARRAATIDPTASSGPVEPGVPGDQGRLWQNGQSLEQPATTHLSIVDGHGNAVSLTASVESAFGSRLFVRGFLLNNQLTDFSFRPDQDGQPVANRVEGGKRPRSSMAPTMVFDQDSGRLVLVVGSPGGSRIIAYVTQAIIAVLDWGLDAQSAVAMGHVVNRNGVTDLEEGTDAAALAEALQAMGHEVSLRSMNSGLHAIVLLPDGTLAGGADPRREGVAAGD